MSNVALPGRSVGMTIEKYGSRLGRGQVGKPARNDGGEPIGQQDARTNQTPSATPSANCPTVRDSCSASAPGMTLSSTTLIER
jgi:hypothetical protein